MKTKDEVTQAFMRDLRELLEKYDAELTAADHWQGYAECGEDVRMSVTIPGKFTDGYTQQLREHTEIDLGRYVDGKAPNARMTCPPESRQEP